MKPEKSAADTLNEAIKRRREKLGMNKLGG